jgi:hypothetical protein
MESERMLVSILLFNKYLLRAYCESGIMGYYSEQDKVFELTVLLRRKPDKQIMTIIISENIKCYQKQSQPE